jgi:hypothetical protein
LARMRPGISSPFSKRSHAVINLFRSGAGRSKAMPEAYRHKALCQRRNDKC